MIAGLDYRPNTLPTNGWEVPESNEAERLALKESQLLELIRDPVFCAKAFERQNGNGVPDVDLFSIYMLKPDLLPDTPPTYLLDNPKFNNLADMLNLRGLMGTLSVLHNVYDVQDRDKLFKAFRALDDRITQEELMLGDIYVGDIYARAVTLTSSIDQGFLTRARKYIASRLASISLGDRIQELKTGSSKFSNISVGYFSSLLYQARLFYPEFFINMGVDSRVLEPILDQVLGWGLEPGVIESNFSLLPLLMHKYYVISAKQVILEPGKPMVVISRDDFGRPPAVEYTPPEESKI